MLGIFTAKIGLSNLFLTNLNMDYRMALSWIGISVELKRTVADRVDVKMSIADLVEIHSNMSSLILD